MKSLVSYQKNNNYFNSLQSKLENPITESFDSLFKYHGSEFDSILHKLSIYNYRCANPNFIHESTKNVYFTLEESYAARNFLISIVSEYERSLYEEFCNEHNIIITEGLDSIKNFYSKIKDEVKSGDSKAIEGFKALGEKVKQLKEFIKDVLNNVIKTAKDLFKRITSMMISIGTSLVELITKLVGDKHLDEFEENFDKLTQEAIKTQANSKENIFESFHNEYVKNECLERIDEGIWDTIKTKSKGFFTWKNIKAIGLNLLLQQMAYYTVCWVIPAAVTLACPPAGALAETLCKLIWSASSIWKQLKSMWEYTHSPEYKEAKKWKKVLRWVLFIVSIGWSLYTLGNTGLDAKKQIDHIITNGTWEGLLPSDAVLNVTKYLNNIWKAITGSDAEGYKTAILWKNDQVIKKFEEVAGEGEGSKEGKVDNLSTTNDMERIKSVAGNGKGADDFADTIEKDYIKANIKGTSNCHDAIENIGKNTPIHSQNDMVIAVDAATKNAIERGGLPGVAAGSNNIDATQATCLAAKAAHSGTGTVYLVRIIDLAPTPENISAVQQSIANLDGGWSCPLSAPLQATEIPVISNSFSWCGGFFPTTQKPFGGFKMRLGSEGTRNYVYNVPKNGVRGIKYSEFISKYGDLNPKVISKMESLIDSKIAALETSKSELEKKKQLSKDDKKFLKQLTENLEKSKEFKSEAPIYVFYTDDELASKTKEINSSKTKQSKKTKKDKVTPKEESYHELLGLHDEQIFESKSDQYPIMFINPTIICGGDLAPRRKNLKSRTKLYPMKGLLSRLQFIDNGDMSEEAILDILCGMFEDGIKENYIMTIPIPCIKDGKEYVVNKDSKIPADEERIDYGAFTNKELADLFNAKKMQYELAQYLGGQHASDLFSGGSHDYNEQSNTKKRKEHKEQRQKVYKDIFTNDEDIKEFLDKHKDIKDLFYTDGELDEKKLDDISIYFERFENTYLVKKKINDDGLFDKFKRLVTGEKKSAIESKDFLNFVKLVVDKRVAIENKKFRKKSKKSKKSSEEVTDNNSLFDDNSYDIVNENEYDDIDDDIEDDIDESIDDLTFLKLNMKHLLEDYYENHE